MTVYVLRGYDLVLKWEYNNDTKPADFSFITWEVLLKGVGWKKLKQENRDGLLIDHPEQPLQFQNRLEKRHQATLVIENATFGDSSLKYRCILTAVDSARTVSAVVNVIVTGMQSILL